MSDDTTNTTPNLDPEHVKQGRKNAIERLTLTRPLVMRLYEGVGLLVEHLEMHSEKGDSDAAIILMTCHLLIDTIKDEMNHWLPMAASDTPGTTPEATQQPRRMIKAND